MIPKAAQIRLDPETRSELESWLRASTTEQRMTRRARIILLAAEGKGSRAIAREIGVRPRVVSTWRMRFAARGIERLKDGRAPNWSILKQRTSAFWQCSISRSLRAAPAGLVS